MTEDVPADPPRLRKARLVTLVGAVLFTLAGGLVVTHVARKHQRARDARITIAKLQAGLDALRPKGRSDVHAVINGVRSHIVFASAPQGRADAAAVVAASCGQDAETGGGDAVPSGDTPAKRYVREAVRREDAPDGSASSVLCIFRSAETGERFERFTFVRGDDRTASLTSVTRESKADLGEMFPAEGDAPGDDLSGVPRPEGSRRVVSATVVESGHAVRIYELRQPAGSTKDLEARREAFDRQMRSAGYEPSADVAKVLEDTRLYVRGKDRIVVAVQPFGEVTRVVINRVDLL